MHIDTAIAEAKEFLWRHPYVTTEFDNPVEILGDIVHAYDAEDGVNRSERLLAFIKRLHEERKIGVVDYRYACSIK